MSLLRKAQALGRKVLNGLGTLVTPDTLLPGTDGVQVELQLPARAGS